MASKMLVVFATLSAIVAIAHVFVEIAPKPYPAAVSFGVPIMLAVVAAVDRLSARSIWLPLLLLTFAVFNAGRLRAAWLIPVMFAAVAIWLFRESSLARPNKGGQVSPLTWWVAGTVILALCVLYGPDIVVAVLGIPTTDR